MFGSRFTWFMVHSQKKTPLKFLKVSFLFLGHGSRFTLKKKETRTDLDRFREIEIYLVHCSHGSWFAVIKRHLENF